MLSYWLSTVPEYKSWFIKQCLASRHYSKALLDDRKKIMFMFWKSGENEKVNVMLQMAITIDAIEIISAFERERQEYCVSGELPL